MPEKLERDVEIKIKRELIAAVTKVMIKETERQNAHFKQLLAKSEARVEKLLAKKRP